jgi:hypothetical protein
LVVLKGVNMHQSLPADKSTVSGYILERKTGNSSLGFIVRLILAIPFPVAGSRIAREPSPLLNLQKMDVLVKKQNR